ncbi:MAG: hypothetical protein RMK64_07640 [Rhodovarius sp.]|nr:hypothetical protein [Rhodovarius sp.]MDW8314827.1 hypothetical protein [Rhodovarius sp.]
MALPDEPFPYAAFITRHLLQPLSPADPLRRAAAETEQPLDGDRWFWADDNAKILEFLTLPALWRRCQEEVAALFAFLQDMIEGPLILRRIGWPLLEAQGEAGGWLRFRHTFMSIAADLPRGVVQAGMRFHDGRDARNLTLTGNRVAARIGGAWQEWPVEPHITACGSEQRSGQLTLWHAADLPLPAAGGQGQRFGRILHRYRFSAASMAIEAEAEFDLEPGIAAEEVVLTLAQAELSHGQGGISHGAVHALLSDGGGLSLQVEKAGEEHRPVPGLRYYSLAQTGTMRGFASGIHALPRNPAAVHALAWRAEGSGRLAWMTAEHRFLRPAPGARLLAAERKLITSGFLHERLADGARLLSALPQRSPLLPLDLSISYDYGAEMVALARGVRGLSAGVLFDAAHSASLLQLHEQLWRGYEEAFLAPARQDAGVIFSRSLAFVALSLCDLLAAGEVARQRERLALLIDLLLGLERRQRDAAGGEAGVFPMTVRDPHSAFLDCQAAALLALVRAAPWLKDRRIGPAVARGLNALCLASMPVGFGPPRLHDLVAVAIEAEEEGRPPLLREGFWNFCSALALRAIRAARASPDAGVRAAVEALADRLAVFEPVLRARIERSARPRGDAIEIRTSTLSAEGNSETQPWVALALIRDNGDH